MREMIRWLLVVGALLVGNVSLADMNDEPLLFSLSAHELEWLRDSSGSSLAWDVQAWYGTTRDRAVARVEGEADKHETESFETTLVYSRAVSPFWNMHLGWRGDWQPAARRNWAAVEFEGLAPGFVETRVSLLAASHGRYSARLKLESQWQLSLRWELVPLLETDWYSDADPVNERGDGFSELEAGLRLRYMVQRKVMPYIGVSWNRRLGDSADIARADNQAVSTTQIVAGLSFWF